MKNTYLSVSQSFKSLIPLIFILVFFSSCDPNRVYEKNVHINPSGWPVVEKVLFEVPVSDSVLFHNFYINLRHTENYQFSNLYLFIDTQFPEGSQSRDTIELVLADNTGKWYGEGFGKIKEYQVLIRQAVVFPVTGTYTIGITHGMRKENLEEIEDVGIRIERMEIN